MIQLLNSLFVLIKQIYLLISCITQFLNRILFCLKSFHHLWLQLVRMLFINILKDLFLRYKWKQLVHDKIFLKKIIKISNYEKFIYLFVKAWVLEMVCYDNYCFPRLMSFVSFSNTSSHFFYLFLSSAVFQSINVLFLIFLYALNILKVYFA